MGHGQGGCGCSCSCQHHPREWEQHVGGQHGGGYAKPQHCCSTGTGAALPAGCQALAEAARFLPAANPTRTTCLPSGLCMYLGFHSASGMCQLRHLSLCGAPWWHSQATLCHAWWGHRAGRWAGAMSPLATPWALARRRGLCPAVGLSEHSPPTGQRAVCSCRGGISSVGQGMALSAPLTATGVGYAGVGYAGMGAGGTEWVLGGAQDWCWDMEWVQGRHGMAAGWCGDGCWATTGL